MDQTPNPKPKPTFDPKDIEQNKGVAALSYLWILFAVPLFLKRDSKFAQFHAKQGLVLFVFELFGFIPVIGWFLWLAAVLASIYGILEAWNGRATRIPFVADLAEMINL